MLQQTLYNSVKIISLDRNRLLSRLRAIAKQVCAERLEVADVRVFGSIARGDHVRTNDVDVLILLYADERGDPIEQVCSFYPYFDLSIGVDLLVYTQEQLAHRLHFGDMFVKQMWQESQSLVNGNAATGQNGTARFRELLLAR